MSNPTTTCRWVLASGEYCEKPVKWNNVLEDDGVRYRKYKTWCPEHEERALAQKAAEKLEDLA